MRRSIARIASVLALALATAALAGAAAAGNGNGNGTENAPGQVKQDQAAQPAQAQPQQAPPGQVKKEQAASPQAAPPSAQSNGVNSTQAGKKPSNTTSKWTHCATGGGQGASATCTGVKGTPADQPDVSKRYGNGKTAAQIANGRGAPAGTLLTGPGNSQPHKVTACGKPNNKSGGVDVHAVKSYDSAKCQAAVSTEQPSVKEEHVCGAVITAGKTKEVVGVLHGSHEHLMVHKKSATGETCGNAPQTQSNGSQAQSSESQTQSSIVVQALPATQGLPAAQSQPATASASSATPNATAAQSTPAATEGQGGVAGVQASLNHPTKSKGGVLGAAGTIAGASLPFTGFPIWGAVLIAIALIAAGLMVRRRGPNAPRI